MTDRTNHRDHLEARTDELLSEAERLKAQRDRTPWWRPLRRRRADRAWLGAVGALQENERQRGRSR